MLKLNAKEIIGRRDQAFTTWRVFLWLTVPLYLLDQVTKLAILNSFDLPTGRGGGQIPVIPGFFNIVRVHNQGMAFGVGNGAPFSNLIFVSIATLAVIFVVNLWKRDAFPTMMSKIAIGSLIAGIFGNVTDRLRIGYVVDFLDFHLGQWHYPSFNVADSCICVAAGLLIWSSLKGDEQEVSKESSTSTTEAPSSSD